MANPERVKEILSTLATPDKYNPDEPDGWLDGTPYYLLNPNLHKASLAIDFGLRFIKYDVKRGLDMYMRG